GGGVVAAGWSLPRVGRWGGRAGVVGACAQGAPPASLPARAAVADTGSRQCRKAVRPCGTLFLPARRIVLVIPVFVLRDRAPLKAAAPWNRYPVGLPSG